jgi:hypothetical protein
MDETKEDEKKTFSEYLKTKYATTASVESMGLAIMHPRHVETSVENKLLFILKWPFSLIVLKLILDQYAGAQRPGNIGIHIYVFAWNPSNPWGQGTLHVCSYCGKPTARAGKTHPFT